MGEVPDPAYHLERTQHYNLGHYITPCFPNLQMYAVFVRVALSLQAWCVSPSQPKSDNYIRWIVLTHLFCETNEQRKREPLQKVVKIVILI